MIFSKDLLFIHVPKTGGTSVSRYLLDVLPRPIYYVLDTTITEPGIVQVPGIGHESLNEAREVVSRYGFDINGFPVILAVMRNPYSMEVSRYAYLRKGYPRDKGPNQELALFEDFETFAVESAKHIDPNRAFQSYFLLDGESPKNLHVIKMENLKEGVAKVLRTIDINNDASLPRVNKSDHDHFSSYYTKAAEEAVYRRYKWAFDNGFYERLDPSNFTFVKKAPSGSPKVPIGSSVRQVSPSSGLWHDSWVASALKFRVAVEKPINSITIEGDFPHRYQNGINLGLRIDEQQATATFEQAAALSENDRFFQWSVPCNIGPNTEAEIELTPSAVFSPKDIEESADDRLLSFLLYRFVFEYEPLNGESQALVHRAPVEVARLEALETVEGADTGAPDLKSWESVSSAIREYASNEEYSEEIAQLLEQILPRYVNSPLYSEYFRMWGEHNFQLAPTRYDSPIPDTRDLTDDVWAKPSELVGIEINEAVQRRLLKEDFPAFRDEYEAFPTAPTAKRSEFHLNNDRFDGTDALALYCMVRHFRPSRILHVGSGFSSRVSAQAALKNGHTELICIEPYPDDILREGFPGLTSLIPKKVQGVELDYFEKLNAGDILFVDSSHVANIGGDVSYLLLEVVPRLKPGVLVHFHAVFLPMEYRRDRVLDESRFWTEQYLLQAFLSFNSAYQVLLCNGYLGYKYRDEMQDTFPNSPWWGGGSFWMRRKSG